MPRGTRLQFNVRRGQRLGEKLILRYPNQTAAVAQQIKHASGSSELPNQITIGYYFQRPETGAWAFAPAGTELSVGALNVDAVRDRICDDLMLFERERAQSK